MGKRGEDLQKRKRKKYLGKKDINVRLNKSNNEWSGGSWCLVGKLTNGITNGCFFSHIDILNN